MWRPHEQYDGTTGLFIYLVVVEDKRDILLYSSV